MKKESGLNHQRRAEAHGGEQLPEILPTHPGALCQRARHAEIAKGDLHEAERIDAEDEVEEDAGDHKGIDRAVFSDGPPSPSARRAAVVKLLAPSLVSFTPPRAGDGKRGAGRSCALRSRSSGIRRSRNPGACPWIRSTRAPCRAAHRCRRP